MIILRPCTLSVAHEEMLGSPLEAIADEAGGVHVTRRLKCAWDSRHILGRELLGYWEQLGINVIEHEPHRWLAISDILFVTAVSIAPFSPKMADNLTDTRFAEYDNAVLTVTYTIPQMVESQTYGRLIRITETLQGASEYLTYSTEGLQWASDDAPLDVMEAPAGFSSLIEWTYHIAGAISLPVSLPLYPGKVNDAAVTSFSLGYTFPKWTLLCENPTIIRETTPDGVIYDVTLRFLYKNNGTMTEVGAKGWQHFPRLSKTGDIDWERIEDSNGDAKLFYIEKYFGDIMV